MQNHLPKKKKSNQKKTTNVTFVMSVLQMQNWNGGTPKPTQLTKVTSVRCVKKYSYERITVSNNTVHKGPSIRMWISFNAFFMWKLGYMLVSILFLSANSWNVFWWWWSKRNVAGSKTLPIWGRFSSQTDQISASSHTCAHLHAIIQIARATSHRVRQTH